MSHRKVLLLLLVSLFTACSTTQDKPGSASVQDKGSTAGSDADGAGGVRAYGAEAGRGTSMTELNDPQSPLSVRIIYFDYDSSEIQAQFRDTIEAHSAFLMANPEIVVSLEGHADERGSREYNLALGERRSQTVKKQMVLLGVSASQVRTTSYGEERPVTEEHDEFAWSQNRRVEIIY